MKKRINIMIDEDVYKLVKKEKINMSGLIGILIKSYFYSKIFYIKNIKIKEIERYYRDNYEKKK